MKLDFRQRLLTTTLLVGASMIASPALAKADAQPTPPTCPPGVAPGTNGCVEGATPATPVTTGPQAAVPPAAVGTNANGAPATGQQEIVVTGSRIPQPNLETASPVTTVTSQEVKVAGTTRTEDLVNALPQVFADQGATSVNPVVGIATIDLRGLRPKRNLVLVNGKRLMAGDTTDPVADINFIPQQLIKRVDVLTGGASAVYGADAVAGVVNFILDTTFTGFRIDGEASVFQHNNNTNADILAANARKGFLPPHGNVVDGGAQDIAAMFGAAFDDGRGHVTAYATYRSQDEILQSARDYSFCGLGGNDASDVPSLGLFSCGGSSTSATGSFFTNVGTFQVMGNQFVPGRTLFNFQPFNYFQRPDERYNLGAFADYEIAPGAHPYIEAMFMDDHTDAQIAPSGAFLGKQGLNTINCDNPLLSAQQFNTICNPATGNLVGQTPHFDANGNLTSVTGTPTLFPNGTGGTFTKAHAYIARRNVEGGARDDDLRHEDFRIVAGMRGEPWRGITYDAYYQTGQTVRQENTQGDLSEQRILFALDTVTDPATGLPVCRATLTGDPAAVGCVPFNIFQTGGVTQAAEQFLTVPSFAHGVISENIAHADVTVAGADYGIQTPWSDTGVGLNVGVEYRHEGLDFRDDLENQTGDLAGGGGPIPPVSGHFDVREAFGELQVPIVEHGFVDELSLDGGFRKSNYHIGARSLNTNTYKLEARFAPIPDVRFRASYNRAVRAPNIIELFTPQALGLTGNQDPCANQTNTGVPLANLAQCQLSGVTAAQFGHILDNPAHQFQGLFGGNPNLVPETADTWTAGVILQPRFIPGLAFTTDYFNIHVKNVIGSLSFATILNGCLGFGVTQNQALCAFVHRNPNNGSLFIGNNAFINVGNINEAGLGLATKGVDVNGTYSRRLGGLGTLNLSFVGTRLLKLTGLLFNNINCAGLYGGNCGGPNGNPSPKWRHKARISLTMPNGLGASIAWRYFSPAELEHPAGQAVPPGDARLAAASFFDLAFTARLQQRLNLRLGVNNILDKDPPIVGDTAIPGNTFPQVYDSMGRFFFAGATVDF